jgi:hypothetical protein
MIDEQQPAYATDRDMSWVLTSVMILVLLFAFPFLFFMVTFDVTLQMVRLYYRFIEGEGKYGEHQQLVLRRLGDGASPRLARTTAA